MKVRVQTAYDRDPGPQLDCSGDPGLTDGSQAAACDINNILARYTKSGQLPEMIRQDGRYGDFSSVPTFQEALEVVTLAEEQFAALPSKVREKFNNSPAEMLAFVENKATTREMLIEHGLADPSQAKPVPPGEAEKPGKEAKPS